MTHCLAFLLSVAIATPAVAQAPPRPPQQGDDDTPEIIVNGQRERGAVQTDFAPELQLRPADIRALGASNVAELLAAIAPQISSGRGRGGDAPVVLIAGRRISGFDEIRDLPSEAIARVDILPEEVALQYGYRADQKVVNFVLRRRFRALTLEAEPQIATDGDRPEVEFKAGLLRLGEGSRLSINSEYEHQAALLERDRRIAATSGAFIDQRSYRSLLPEGDRLLLSATLNRMLTKSVSVTLSTKLENADFASQLGIANSGARLDRKATARTARLGLVLDGNIAKWRWSLTGKADSVLDRSATDNAVTPATRDTAKGMEHVLGADFVTSGPLLDLPAGKVNASFKAGFILNGFESRAIRSGLASAASLSRDTASGQASFDFPIASRSKAVLAPLGNLSVNFNIARNRLSDFGTLGTTGYGLNWSPAKPVEFIASTTVEDGAPSVQQLGNPLLSTPNVRIFDQARGETVNIIRVTGGNGSLRTDRRRVWKLGATLKPLGETDLTLRADYTKQRISNPILAFPTLSPAIEAAFPDRIQRDGGGRLIRVDARPVNFIRSESEQLRWGLNFSKAVGKAPPPPSADTIQRLREQFGGRGFGGGGSGGSAAPDQRGPASGDGARPGGGQGGGQGGGPGGFGRGFADFQRARVQFAIFHTWHFNETVVVANGLPQLDLLKGAGLTSGGGVPRHEVELQAGFYKRGMGARLTGNWQSATSLRANPFGTASLNDLNFSCLATFNLRLFADLGSRPEIILKKPWLRGLRVRLAVDNLFNARPRVTDARGLTPLGYQPDLLSPLGRTISLSVRKQFR
jgi:iron complex outermembrane recepter protein